MVIRQVFVCKAIVTGRWTESGAGARALQRVPVFAGLAGNKFTPLRSEAMQGKKFRVGDEVSQDQSGLIEPIARIRVAEGLRKPARECCNGLARF